MNSRILHRMLTAVLLSMPLWSSSPANAYTALIEGEVVRTLVANDGRWGGCMVQLRSDISISSELPACANGWVTFSCSGDFQTASRAKLSFSQALVAFSTDSMVKVLVNDAKQHNGYCFAERFDLTKY